MLKERAGASFEELSRQTGVSRSSLHRYCSGAKVPTAYGPVHAFAKACGATSDELRDLHRLWALADSARSDQAAPWDEADSGSPEAAGPETDPAAGGEPMRPADGRTGKGLPDGVAGRRGWPLRAGGRRVPVAAVAATVLVVAGVAAFVVFNTASGDNAPTISESSPGALPVSTVRVYNVEQGCRTRAERIPACSMGLARDPRLKYAAGNVVAHRVWHGDVLRTDCVLYDGDRVEDETGVGTTRWFRVLLDDVPGGYGWLPAVRTHDNPKLPVCT
ncbi:Helix-turn-helix domain-containing protein [Nonomuraea jiangxiensis]|uniref:Helix-turn-helix domain-containing protein n=2 Tax=Nonomuraea jiangxiensis TaxID=633440 RepID=A0A1G8LW87_9ACTN|nr:Helix-turn-helix domain-containing protein [Nonomuraea jiangxiensis]